MHVDSNSYAFPIREDSDCFAISAQCIPGIVMAIVGIVIAIGVVIFIVITNQLTLDYGF